MANFQPLKQRFLRDLGRFIDRYQMLADNSAFLDFGAGKGDVTRYILNRRGSSALRAWMVDSDSEAREAWIASGSPPHAACADLSEVTGPLSLTLAFDVLEHLPQPAETLRMLAAKMQDDAHLVVTVPYRPSQWGWDDSYYGHYHRKGRNEWIETIETSGFEVMEVVDPTFPLYWLCRAFMLRFSRPPAKDTLGTPELRSSASSRRFAFRAGRLVQMASFCIPWKWVDRLFTPLFQHIYLGHELMIVARLTSRPPDCPICLTGRYAFYVADGTCALQRCSSCRSLRSAPPLSTEQIRRLYQNSYRRGAQGGKRFSGAIEALSCLARRCRANALLRHNTLARSALDIGCGRGEMLQTLMAKGLTVAGTELNTDLVEANRQKGLDIRTDTAVWIQERRTFDIITLFHVIEHVDHPSQIFDDVTRLANVNSLCMVEIPNGNSLLHRLFGPLWFGRDLPFHRFHMNPQALNRAFETRGWTRIEFSQWSWEFGFFIAAQTMGNLMITCVGTSRGAIYRVLRGEGSCVIRFWALLQIPLFVLGLFAYPVWFVLTAPFGRSEIVRVLFRKQENPHG